MKRELTYGSCRFCYTLTRKRVKRINARVTKTGEIAVSAPPSVKAERIDAFILSNAAKLLYAAEKQKKAAVVPEIGEGSTLSILGNPYTLRILRGTRRSAFLDHEKKEVHVILQEKDGAQAAEKALSACLEREAASLLTKRFDKAYSAHFSPLFAKPALRFRRMRGSWGNCRSKSGVITLNLRLFYAPREAIEYVLLHELVHMLHPNHSQSFWQTLALYMPDYKAARAALKGVPIAFDRFL